MTPDFARYVGIPFADHGRDASGCDCWGLVRLFYREQFGIELSDMGPAYRDTTDADGMRRVHEDQLACWRPVNDPAPGDAVLLAVLGAPVHVGVALDRRRMLHAQRGVDVVIERLDRPLWQNRFKGFYRHAARS